MITHISTDDDLRHGICGRLIDERDDVFWWDAEYIPRMSSKIQATITCAECAHEVEALKARRKQEAEPMDAAPEAELTDEAREWLIEFASGDTLPA